MQNEEELLTLNETAAVLRVSRPTVVSLIAAGDLPAARVGTQYRVFRGALNTYLEGDGQSLKIQDGCYALLAGCSHPVMVYKSTARGYQYRDLVTNEFGYTWRASLLLSRDEANRLAQPPQTSVELTARAKEISERTGQPRDEVWSELRRWMNGDEL